MTSQGIDEGATVGAQPAKSVEIGPFGNTGTDQPPRPRGEFTTASSNANG